ncbi:hypothetical protein [Synechococcus sp. CS-1332]|uniref:hypothetical protein n=1 Tax=Synechococcus sp. CS-1332 TaxID=2847972 RepID=UPI00223B4C1D|nr:hypothetical protein [Synechococcus sp. CS-1332]MCT0206817.1 hypothetical protein [Synechococcus sp. CS-1332]
MGLRIDQATFLERAISRFGARYDYSQMIYKSFRTPIKIRCVEHPVREVVITPERHLQTTGGCKYCLRNYRNMTLERVLRMECEPSELAAPLLPRAPQEPPVAGQKSKAV